MGFRPIIFRGKTLKLHRPMIDPDFNSRLVLAGDTWTYVQMWLAYDRKLRDDTRKEALLHWEQARNFSSASLSLPQTSSPLTAYFSALNATKTLLLVKNRQYSDYHGVTGDDNVAKKASLSNTKIIFKSKGVLSALCNYLGEEAIGEYTLKDILYNLPCVHRAYTLTFPSRPELFIPIEHPRFVRKDRSSESWFCAEVVNSKHASKRIATKLPNDFQLDAGVPDRFVVRATRRFQWRRGDKGNLRRLTNYHRWVRRHTHYIHGTSVLWYLKRGGAIKGRIDRSCLTLRFAALHRLSELVRYQPQLLDRHFHVKHNWLLSEFISRCLYQYVDEVACEITGREILVPGYR